MDIVTFETAKRLKAAGFAKFSISPSSLWYDKSGRMFVITQNTGEGSDFTFKGSYLGGGLISGPIRDYCHYYAPTATDILNHSGERLAIFTPMEGGGFICGKLSGDTTTFEHANPAEAAALAYLTIHEHHAAQPTTDTKV